MVYVEITIEIPRHRVREALEAFEKNAFPWDEAAMQKVGARTIGCWHTLDGRQGEITFLLAYPSLAEREKLLSLGDQDAELSNWVKGVWQAKYSPFATVKVLRPAPFSPLQ